MSEIAFTVMDLEEHGLPELGHLFLNRYLELTGDYPEDSFDNMKRVAEAHGYGFPYLLDQSQGTAKAYGAVCTPDFFGYNADLELQYRGRLDASGRNSDTGEVERDLFLAMKQVAETGRGPRQQVASIGCSLKWRA